MVRRLSWHQTSKKKRFSIANPSRTSEACGSPQSKEPHFLKQQWSRVNLGGCKLNQAGPLANRPNSVMYSTSFCDLFQPNQTLKTSGNAESNVCLLVHKCLQRLPMYAYAFVSSWNQNARNTFNIKPAPGIFGAWHCPGIQHRTCPNMFVVSRSVLLSSVCLAGNTEIGIDARMRG